MPSTDPHVAFLRGMNIGGRRIANADLRTRFEALGCEGVATFRASGNVVFSMQGSAAELTALLEEGLAESLGYEVPVFLRAAAEVRAMAVASPFEQRRVEASKGKLQVALLREGPAPDVARGALALATEADRLAIAGRELYWLPSGGISESDLDLEALAGLLGPMTIRTKGTIDQLAAKYLPL